MRLAPIERPPTLFARLVFLVLKRVLGKVPTPYRVVFTRMPHALFAHMMMVGVLDRRVRLDPDLKVLLESHVATMNHCTFCLDLVQAMALKRNPEYKDIPIVIVSGKSEVESIRAAFSAGAAAYFVKPLDVGRLVDKVKQLARGTA